MYIKKIIDKNVGPIKDLEINFEFNENGDPKPTILVGENGTGKSTLLSNIVDSLYECAGVRFSDALKFNTNGSGTQLYYKTIKSDEITNGQKYLFSYIEFLDNKTKPSKIEYIYKGGEISAKDFEDITKIKFSSTFSWDNKNGYKEVSINKETSGKIFEQNILCYFSPDRYEKPAWLGDKYYKLSDYEHPTVLEKEYSHLINTISVNNMTINNLTWLLDILIDSRTEMIELGPGNYEPGTDIQSLKRLNLSKKNVETLLSQILGKRILFDLNFRNQNSSRLKIKSADNYSLILPSIDALSTGQSALFHLFATIIRYADNNNINYSINLNTINGIVIIDEIELHLHSNLQYEILPNLISLFPKIQFIITTHSPLFLLGMEKKFSEKGLSIYDMPKGTKITTERFSEFHKSYEYLMNTQKHEKEINEIIAQNNSKMLILTERATDWKHMKAAYEDLKAKEEYKEIFDDLEFEFLEYGSETSIGDKELLKMCNTYHITKRTQKQVFIFDRDNENLIKDVNDEGKLYKNWGNNIYSFSIPIPNFREKTPLISIEHLYSDKVIKTQVLFNDTNIYRRLYLGYEFDTRGISSELSLFCEKRNICGPNNISIIEGSNKEKVTKLNNNDNINLALPKMTFANMILDKKSPFDNVNFENFIEIFRILKEIQKN
ncbi:MAG: AAA family ATPase [Pleomorphochaeta sp.]